MVGFFVPAMMNIVAASATLLEGASDQLSETDESSHTFSEVSLGSYSHIIVAVGWRGTSNTARTLTSATIGGGAATIAIQLSGSQGLGVALLIAVRGVGDSVALNFDDQVTAVGIAPHGVNGLISTTPADTASGQAAGTGALSTSDSLTPVIDGISIGAFYGSIGGAGPLNVTGDLINTNDIYLNDDHFKSAMLANNSATPITVGLDANVGISHALVMVAASFR